MVAQIVGDCILRWSIDSKRFAICEDPHGREIACHVFSGIFILICSNVLNIDIDFLLVLLSYLVVSLFQNRIIPYYLGPEETLLSTIPRCAVSLKVSFASDSI